MRQNKQDPRMALLAKELGIAIFQVMTDYYQFDEAEANKAVQLVYGQAKSNRAQLQGAAIAAHLAADKPENVCFPVTI